MYKKVFAMVEDRAWRPRSAPWWGSLFEALVYLQRRNYSPSACLAAFYYVAAAFTFLIALAFSVFVLIMQSPALVFLFVGSALLWYLGRWFDASR